MMLEAEEYVSLLVDNEEWLKQRILHFARQYNYTKYTSKLQDSWIVPVNEVSGSLVMAVKTYGIDPPGLHPDEEITTDPVSFLGQVEARRHKQHGVTLCVFLALIKYYRQSYIDLIEETNVDDQKKKTFCRFTNCCFDRFELGYVSEWTSIADNMESHECQASIRENGYEKNRYLTVFESLFAPIILLDDSNKVINYNLAAAHLFSDLQVALELYNSSIGSGSLKEIGRRIGKFIPSPDKELIFEESMDTNIGKRYFKVLFKKALDMGDKFRGTIIMLQDLTEQHTTEENLQVAKLKAEEADTLKTAFLANVSHEIRTPMNAIIGFTDLLLRDGQLKKSGGEYLKLIRKSSTDLLNIIEDIIDIAKMESKQLKIKNKACSPYEILTDCNAVFSETLRKYGTNNSVKLILNVDRNEEELILFTDGERLKQVISNLLNNAVKFTDEGYIEFGYRVKNSNRVFFYVRDTGKGIPEAMKGKVFERFFQLNEDLKMNLGGSGLGLAISKNIVELLGGIIKVDTVEGKGSEFSFELPLQEGPMRKQEIAGTGLADKKPEYPLWNGKVVLIAEDDEINYLYLKELVNRTGAQVLHAADGLQAIDLIETNEKIDLILMDIKMPRVGGIEATQYISTIRPGIPIVAQTAYVMDGDKARCIDAGCCAYITKPVDSQTFYRVIEKYISRKNHYHESFLIKFKPD